MSMGLDPLATVRGVGLDQYKAGLGEYLGAVAGDAWANGPLAQIGRIAQASDRQLDAEQRGEPLLSAKEASDEGRELGLRFEQPIARGAFNVLADEKRRQAADEAIFKRARLEEGYGTLHWLLAGGTEFLVQAADPINLASAFVPVVGEARGAAMAARIGGLPAALVKGAAEGAVGQALLEPLNYLDRRAQGGDYTMLDTLQNLAFGAGLGVALHGTAYGVGAGFRFMRDRFVVKEVAGRTAGAEALAARDERLAEAPAGRPEPPPGRPEPPVIEKDSSPPPRQPVAEAMETLRPETKEAAMRAAVAQLAQDRPVDIETVLRSDPAWPQVQVAIEDLQAHHALQGEAIAANPLPPHQPPPDFRPSPEELAQARRATRGLDPETPMARPERLSEFVRRVGGLTEGTPEAGDLLAAEPKQRGLIGPKGRQADHLALAAQEAGYRVGETRDGNGADLQAFMNALIEDAGGKAEHLPQTDYTEAWRAQQAFFDNYSRYLKEGLGLDPKGMDPRQLAWLLRQDETTGRLMALAAQVERLGDNASLELAMRLDEERARLEAEVLAEEPGALEPGPIRRHELANATGPKIEVITRIRPEDPVKAGRVAFALDKDGIHGLSGRVRDGALIVGASGIDEGMRGQGHGLALYERAINWAEEHGLAFHSDGEVSPAAQRVYDALIQRGYDVQRQPGATRRDGQAFRAAGTLYRDDGPVFIVKSAETSPEHRPSATLEELERYYADYERAAGPREPGQEAAGREPVAGRAGESGEAGAARPAGDRDPAAGAGLRREGEGAQGSEGAGADVAPPTPDDLARFAERQQSADLHADPAALAGRDERLAGEARETAQLLADDLRDYGHLLDDDARFLVEESGRIFDDESKAIDALASCQMGGA
jgi:GNAT superfamily N-acetyltransferase